MQQAREKLLLEKNVTFRAKKFAKRTLVLNKSHFFFQFLHAISLLLFVISERVVNAACAKKFLQEETVTFYYC